MRPSIAEIEINVEINKSKRINKRMKWNLSLVLVQGTKITDSSRY